MGLSKGTAVKVVKDASNAAETAAHALGSAVIDSAQIAARKAQNLGYTSAIVQTMVTAGHVSPLGDSSRFSVADAIQKVFEALESAAVVDETPESAPATPVVRYDFMLLMADGRAVRISRSGDASYQDALARAQEIYGAQNVQEVPAA